MCGIFAVINDERNANALETSIKGMSRLENRGYDSVGVAFVVGEEIIIKKAVKKTAIELYEEINPFNLALKVKIAIGHNRWSTNGVVDKFNAHPHCDNQNRFVLVHNGIIENADKLKNSSVLKGVSYQSQTDTEVLVNLLSKLYDNFGNMDLVISELLKTIKGDNAFVFMDFNNPTSLTAVKTGNATLFTAKIGNNLLVASEPRAFFDCCDKKEFSYFALESGDYATISGGEIVIKNNARFVRRKPITIGKEFFDEAHLNQYEHFMQKEIFEEPAVCERILNSGIKTSIEKESEFFKILKDVKRFHFIGCGTSYFAAHFASVLFNKFGIKAGHYLASEFNLRDYVFDDGDAFVLISQSGGTADLIRVLSDIKKNQDKGADIRSIGLVNCLGSEIDRQVDCTIFMNAGMEIAVASTKAFLAEMLNFLILAVVIYNIKFAEKKFHSIFQKIPALPGQIALVLQKANEIQALAKFMTQYKSSYFLGKGLNAVIAREGALKFKEITYLHAEAYPAGEMKHGPIALVGEDFVCVVLAPDDENLSYMRQTINEISSRKGKIVVFTNAKFNNFNNADYVVRLPECDPLFSPFLNLVALQLLAYYSAIELGNNVDRPRNLAKVVTVI